MNATGSDAADGTGRREEMTPQMLDSEPDLKIVNEGWFLKRIHGAKVRNRIILKAKVRTIFLVCLYETNMIKC